MVIGNEILHRPQFLPYPKFDPLSLGVSNQITKGPSVKLMATTFQKDINDKLDTNLSKILDIYV